MIDRNAIAQHIRAVPDFPQPGVLFRDITPVLADPAAFRTTLDSLRELLAPMRYDHLVALESRGFLFGAPLAVELEKGLVLARKAGKLPCATVSETYALEYGEATIEMHADSLQKGQEVVVIDDLLATGGTARAAGNLVRRVGAELVAYVFVIELEGLAGRKKLADAPVHVLVSYP